MIDKIIPIEMAEGAGAKVKRLMPTPALRNFDPFVLFDHFEIQLPAGFPEHPHRGFEIITYVMEGSIHHRDNAGGEGMIQAGAIQKITAGRGVVHSEMPGGSGVSRGIQLWINLPKRLKGIDPDYQIIEKEVIPVRREGGAEIRVICGEGSPTRLHTSVTYLDVTLEKGSTFVHLNSRAAHLLLYVLEGSLTVESDHLNVGEALLMRDIKEIHIDAIERSRYIYLSGIPHGEPIHQRGPYVD